MVLNWDVLASLFPFLTRRCDQSRLMHTCRTLYDAGIPYLLFRRINLTFLVANIGKPCDLILFCDFILKNVEGRARHIRKTSIYGNPPRGRDWEKTAILELLQKLALILSNCSNLVDLDIGRSEAFFAFAGLRHAIMGLTKLKVVSFCCPGQTTFQVLQGLRAPISSASISCPDPEPQHAGQQASSATRIPANPRAILGALTVHLTELALEGPFSIDDITFTGICFPQVHSLSIHQEDSIDGLQLQTAFPNLRELKWEEGSADRAQDIRESVDVKSNIQGSKQHYWARLHYLMCESSMVYAWAFKCQVRHW